MALSFCKGKFGGYASFHMPNLGGGGILKSAYLRNQCSDEIGGNVETRLSKAVYEKNDISENTAPTIS